MLAREELLLLIYFIVVIVLLTAFAIIFFITFQRRKNKLLIEKYEAQKQYEEEIIRSRLEIQEQTLKNVGWELHDNIGQLLSVANLQLNILARTSGESNPDSIHELKDIVGRSLQEVRALSKSLNSDVVEYAGLEASVTNEIERFNRLNVIEASFSSEGEKFFPPKEDTIILFRILQEFFSNVLKHSKATKLSVVFLYRSGELQITARDNGKGFDVEKVEKSSGLFNMKKRAEIINSSFRLDSALNGGTSLYLSYPTKIKQNEQNDHYR